MVGAGPSGVEFVGELDDFVEQDMSRSFPHLKKYVKITLIEAMPNILTMFDKKLVEFAEESLVSGGVDVRKSTLVTSVDESNIYFKGGDSLAYGSLIWVAGITARPITRRMIERIGDLQTNRNGLIVDKHMVVKGARDIFAIGDCSISGNPPTAQVAAQEVCGVFCKILRTA